MPKKLPWFKFYPDRLLSDESLSACSLAAQGLWTRMFCLMAKSHSYGSLLVGKAPATDEQIARMVGRPLGEVKPLLDELKRSGVASLRDEAICCRFMRKEGDIRRKRSKAGKLGGNPLLKQEVKQEVKHRGKRIEDRLRTASAVLGDGEPPPVQAGSRKPKPYWDLVCELWGFPRNPTDPKKCKQIGGLAKRFKATGATPDEIKIRFARWPLVFRAACTANGLLNQWEMLSDAHGRRTPQGDGTISARARRKAAESRGCGPGPGVDDVPVL